MQGDQVDDAIAEFQSAVALSEGENEDAIRALAMGLTTLAQAIRADLAEILDRLPERPRGAGGES